MDLESNCSPLKLHLSYVEQLALLKSRGMHVADDAKALAVLRQIGYYRLVGYWYPLRAPHTDSGSGRTDVFRDGASFELTEQLYEFDRKLRLLVINAVQILEVAIRTDIAHLLGKKHRLAHEFEATFDAKFLTSICNKSGQTKYQVWKRKYATAIVRKSREDYVAHHLKKYGGRLPIWVAIEAWDFGLLSTFFAGMKYSDQQRIARQFQINGPVLETWLRATNFVRNAAAHHERLWNRTLPVILRFPHVSPDSSLFHLCGDTFAKRRTYGALAILVHMIKAIRPQSAWHRELEAHCDTFPKSNLVSLSDAGFPDGWKQETLWRD